ncbi:MAG TPA: hypothetical protein VEJ63_09330 [Planctomycetota bacterium]|nr:hypothetical protein [Planctomycetota bacterium]
MKDPAQRDVPDQLFFDFFGARPASDKKPSAAKPSQASEAQPPAAPDKGRGVSPNEQTFRLTETTARSAYMTESRAAEILLQVSQLRPNNTIRKVKVIFKPFRATLYSFKIGKGGKALVKFHVAFRRADDEVIGQAAQIMLLRRVRTSRKPLERGAYDSFVRALSPAEFELPGARKGRQVSVSEPGIHRSLEASFQRVNVEYFQSQLQQPQLCWSPVRARRILGSYQERNDRLIISRLFDSPKVPEFVLDYLMYHELLHKFLGIGRRDDGKRCMHGRDFREIERQFKRYDEAQLFLKTL